MIPALNVEENERRRALRERAELGEALSEAEMADLTDLERRWDAADAARLNAATARVEGDTLLLRAENQSLKELLGRKRELAVRLESMLEQLRAEQTVINAEIARLLTPTEAAELTRVSAR